MTQQDFIVCYSIRPLRFIDCLFGMGARGVAVGVLGSASLATLYAFRKLNSQHLPGRTRTGWP